MIGDKLQEALNRQLNWELYSSYIYLSMSAYFESIGLAGSAGWMRVQAQEEVVHVMKFFTYINERGGRVLMQPIDGPSTEWASLLDAFTDAYKHEQGVTARINDLVDMALEEKDHPTNNFLQWFVAEQVEEEASVGDVIQKLKLVGEASGGLFMLDRELGARIFTMPTEATGGA